MKQLRILYYPRSSNLEHPADRRRLAFWASHQGHRIILDPNMKHDLVVATERSNLGKLHSHYQTPVIFDLVDGYIISDSIVNDFARGYSKIITGSLSGTPKKYTTFIKQMCANSSAVICSSMEQKNLISRFSTNVHVILDSHAEIPLQNYIKRSVPNDKSLFWEGLPATLPALKKVRKVLESNSSVEVEHLNLVTDGHYFQFLGRYLRRSTDTLIKNTLQGSFYKANFKEWTIENLSALSMQSIAAVLPVITESKFQNLKPENRLLIMWRLGLPTVTSRLPSYLRVMNEIELDLTCETQVDWERNISKLFIDADFAEHVVNKGQQYLAERHSTEFLLQKWDSVVESVL
jgi:hypothetical protein